MAGRPKKRGPYKMSQKRIEANRRNSKLSRGPSLEGRARSCMNNTQHGMRSAPERKVLPWESQADFDRHEERITEQINPQTPLDEVLAERVVRQTWRAKRGYKAADARAEKRVDALVKGAKDREITEAERLAGLLDEDRTAVRRLRAFPEGAKHMLNQWYFFRDLLKTSPNLLASQRKRCLALLGKQREDVLRDDPLATRWLRAQISAMHGKEATLEQVASFLGGEPLAKMHQGEFDKRVRRMARSLRAPSEAHQLLIGYVAEVISELEKHAKDVKAVAERNLTLDVTAAALEPTIEGQRIDKHILDCERSYMAALKRMDNPQTPSGSGPGPNGDAKKSRGRAAAVAADAEVTVATSAPAAEPVPAMDEGPTPSAAPLDAPKFTVEPIEGFPSEPAAEESTVEPIEPSPAEPVAEESTVEPIEGPPAQPAAEESTVEPIEGPPEEPDSELCDEAPIPEDPLDEAELERYAPEFARMSKLHCMIEATYGCEQPLGDRGPEPGTHSDGAPRDSPLARAEEQWTAHLKEMSAQLDAHFGIDGNRPDPECPDHAARDGP